MGLNDTLQLTKLLFSKTTVKKNANETFILQIKMKTLKLVYVSLYYLPNELGKYNLAKVLTVQIF